MIYLDHCDLYVVDAAAARGRLGSQTKEALKLYEKNVSCTFFQDNEKVRNDETSDLTSIEVMRILFPPAVVVTERMIVRNIRDRAGAVIEAGPFLIEKLTAHRTIGKVIDHRTAELKKDYSLKEI